MNYKLKEIVIIFVTFVSVSFLAFAEETTNSNITNNTTQSISSTSSNSSVINQTNTNNSTSNITQNSTTNSTINQTNNSTISQTQDITSNINQTQNVNNTSLITNNSTTENTNLNTSNVTSVTTNNNNSINSSSSNIVSDNKNVNQNTNINQSVSSSTQRATQRIKSPPASAIAPNAAMSSYSQDLCTTGASAAVQTQIFGISAGKTIVDKNCVMLKNAKALYDMGMKVAAVSLMCKGNKDIWVAMYNSSTPCPVMVNGKSLIGVDAINYYENNPEERPDYEDIKHRYETKGYEIKAYTKTNFCKKYKKHKLC